MLFIRIQAKDLPIMDIVRKTTLKKVLLQDQKVCAHGQSGPTMAGCVWLCSWLAGWQGCQGEQPPVAHSDTTYNLSFLKLLILGCMPMHMSVAGANPWCSGQQGAAAGPEHHNITAEAEVGYKG